MNEEWLNERVMLFRCSPSGKFHYRIMTQRQSMRWCNLKAKKNWRIFFPYDPTDKADAEIILYTCRQQAKDMAQLENKLKYAR